MRVLSFLLGVGACQAFLMPLTPLKAQTQLSSSGSGGFMDQYNKARESRDGNKGTPSSPKPVPVPVPVNAVPASPASKAPVPTAADYAGYVDEEGEEEGVMEIGVNTNDTDLLAYIPGMENMTKEQYEKAVNDKAIKALEESRARGAGGGRASANYMEALKRPRPPSK